MDILQQEWDQPNMEQTLNMNINSHCFIFQRFLSLCLILQLHFGIFLQYFFFGLIVICETVMDLRFFCFSLSPDLFHMFCPRTLGALSSNSHKSLVYISLIVLSESGFDLGAFILNSLLPSCSLQEPRCAISASMCLPDVFILF